MMNRKIVEKELEFLRFQNFFCLTKKNHSIVYRDDQWMMINLH